MVSVTPHSIETLNGGLPDIKTARIGMFIRYFTDGRCVTLAKRKAGLGSAPRVGLSLSFKSRALMTPAGIQRDQSAMY